MKATLLLASLALLCALEISYAEPKDASNNQVLNFEANDEHVEGQVSFSDGGELTNDEEELHERVKRSPSPWGGRRRRRWRVRVRSAVRKVGRAVRKTVRKVGSAVRKIPQKVKKVVRKAGRAVRRSIRKASRAVRKTVQEVKRAGRKIKTIPRKVDKSIRKIRDKVKESIAKIIIRKKEEEKEEEVVVVPLPTDPVTGPTEPDTTGTPEVIVTTKGCDLDCQSINDFSKSTQFFKQGHCAFYITRRQHRDFFLDRNKNKTLDVWMGDIAKEALELYKAYGEALKTVKTDFVIKTEPQLREACIKSARSTCANMSPQDVMAFYKLKCLKPCAGFSGCTSQDANLVKLINNAITTHDNRLNYAANLA